MASSPLQRIARVLRGLLLFVFGAQLFVVLIARFAPELAILPNAVLGLAVVASAVVMLYWQSRACVQAKELDPELSHGAASPVWWFVPIANLVMPAFVISAIDGVACREGARRSPVLAWWLVLFVARAGVVMTFAIVGPRGIETGTALIALGGGAWGLYLTDRVVHDISAKLASLRGPSDWSAAF